MTQQDLNGRVALVTGGSAIVAWRARRDAEAKRAAAESAEQRMADLIHFLLTDLKQRLEPTGNLGAMESVLEKAVEEFRREYEATGHSPAAALKLADVLVVNGDVLADISILEDRRRILAVLQGGVLRAGELTLRSC